MKRFAIVALAAGLLAAPGILSAQQKWTKTYGGIYEDVGRSVQQTFDGGYIVAGWRDRSVNPPSHPRLWLVKTDASGDTVWTKTYGGTGNDMAYSVQQTSDSGYIVTGYTDSYGSGYGDVWLVKTDAHGDTLWTRTFRNYGGTDGYCGHSVRQTSDGGYIVAGTKDEYGSTAEKVWLVRTNASGDTLWTKTYGPGWGLSVQQTPDGGYAVGGCLGEIYPYLIKTDANGDTIWSKTYGGTGYYGMDVLQTPDGGYAIAAACLDPYGTGYYDAYLVKTDANGDTLWSNVYGGGYYPPDTSNSFAESVRQTADGGYVVTGITNYKGTGTGDVYLVKTDANGDTIWSKTYGGTAQDWGYSVRQASDGGYVVAGTTWSFGAGRSDVYLVKTDANGSAGVEENGKAISRNHAPPPSFRVLPNPFVSFAVVRGHEGERFGLFNIAGKKVGIFRGGRIGEGVPPGVYFLRPEVRGAEPVRVIKIK